MTERSMQHATFFIERTYDASPTRVYAACSDPVLKSQWFGGGGEDYTMDFRIDGKEFNKGGPEGGPIYTYEATYRDIVPNQRIIATYEMFLDDQRISVSLASMEFVPEGSGTKLKFTEQAVFLDGLDNAEQREHGTRALFEGLGEALENGTV